MAINMKPLACLYLHGFLSSPQSKKAQELVQYFTQLAHAKLVVPTLPFAPKEAMALAEVELQQLLKTHPQVLIIGSSLGGYYATYLSQKYGVKAALINPAVRPFDLFEHYLGPHQHFYDGNVYELTQVHIEQLQSFNCPAITDPQFLFLLLQTGDETLDYRQAAEYYQNCRGWYEGGGNHSFTNFIERMPMLLAFLSE